MLGGKRFTQKAEQRVAQKGHGLEGAWEGQMRSGNKSGGGLSKLERPGYCTEEFRLHRKWVAMDASEDQKPIDNICLTVVSKTLEPSRG